MMITRSTTHLVLIPSYNPGAKVYETVRAARSYWNPVWVVVDGSDDGSAEGLLAMAAEDSGLRVMVLPHNQGKGRPAYPASCRSSPAAHRDGTPSISAALRCRRSAAVSSSAVRLVE